MATPPIKIVQGTEPPRNYAKPVPEHVWKSAEPHIRLWHQRRLSCKKILRLLQVSMYEISRNQLETKMKEWGLSMDTRGRGAMPPSSAESSLPSFYDASSPGDEYVCHKHLTGPSADSSNGTVSLRPLLRTHNENAFETGTVFAEIRLPSLDSRHAKIRIWLVTARPVDGKVDCIRIKSYGGRGLLGLFATYPMDDAYKQKEVDAHIILQVRGRTLEKPPQGEPSMSREQLTITPAQDLGPAVFPKMARATFNGRERLSCQEEFTYLGRLDDYSKSLLEIYVRQISDPEPSM